VDNLDFVHAMDVVYAESKPCLRCQELELLVLWGYWVADRDLIVGVGVLVLVVGNRVSFPFGTILLSTC
jgi:hypothetical protein